MNAIREKHTYKAENAIPCPFCGSGSISVKHKELRFLGVNWLGTKKLKMKAYCICNKCKSRGTPIVYIGYTSPGDRGFTEKHLPIYSRGEAAIEAWNQRKNGIDFLKKYSA